MMAALLPHLAHIRVQRLIPPACSLSLPPIRESLDIRFVMVEHVDLAIMCTYSRLAPCYVDRWNPRDVCRRG